MSAAERVPSQRPQRGIKNFASNVASNANNVLRTKFWEHLTGNNRPKADSSSRRRARRALRTAGRASAEEMETQDPDATADDSEIKKRARAGHNVKEPIAKIDEELNERTVFESIDVPGFRPARSRNVTAKLRWKDGASPSKEVAGNEKVEDGREELPPMQSVLEEKEEKGLPQDMPVDVGFRKVKKSTRRRMGSGEKMHMDMPRRDPTMAMRILDIGRRNDVLEHCLLPQQNQVLKRYFENGKKAEDTTAQIVELLDKAIDKMIDVIAFRNEQMDTPIDNDMRWFLINRDAAKQQILEVMLSYPEYIPFAWGGSVYKPGSTDKPKE